MKILLDGRFPEFFRHVAFYRRLGVAGMSSDEEIDRDNRGRRQFLYHRKHYLSEAVSNLGAYLDDIYDRNISPRRYRRVRAESPCLGSVPIPALPVNAYEARWYRSLSKFERSVLCASMERHDFDTLMNV